MKRKDDLLRLAFGELTDDAARAVEARADAADQTEVEAFRQLHDDLRHLPPPPPDNLTAERLRLAILDGELKTRRPLNWGSVVFAPFALAALAAVVLLPRLRPRPEPQIVSTALLERPSSVTAPRFDAFADLKDKDALPPLRAQAIVPKASEATSEVAIPHRRHVRHRTLLESPEEPQMRTDGLVVSTNPGGAAATEEAPSAVAAPAASLPIHEPQTIAAPPSAVVEATPGASGKTETVVIVSSKRDLETGAPAATEKEATSVLVGG